MLSCALLLCCVCWPQQGRLTVEGVIEKGVGGLNTSNPTQYPTWMGSILCA